MRVEKSRFKEHLFKLSKIRETWNLDINIFNQVWSIINTEFFAHKFERYVTHCILRLNPQEN